MMKVPAQRGNFLVFIEISEIKAYNIDELEELL